MSKKTYITTSDVRSMRRHYNKGHTLANDEVGELLDYVEALEALLDRADEDDTFGTEGWRHYWLDQAGHIEDR